jgi:hypothetical protein
MRWAWNVACMGEKGMHIGFWWESQKEHLHIGGRIILKSWRQDGVIWTGFI